MAKDSFIDLGKSYEPKSIEAEVPAEDKKSYPTLYIEHGDESSALNDLPDEGEAVIKYRIVRYTEDLKNDTCRCELEVLGLKPMGEQKQKKSKSSEESLDEALSGIQAKKAKK